MNDTFLTIAAPSEGIYKEKGSKFMAFAYPVCDENEAKERIDALRKKYFDARHHCYAWRIGVTNIAGVTNAASTANTAGERFRANDDGEPSNSAGKPILGQITAAGVTNVLVVVVRYFGGVLLGVGRLMQAYKQAAADALANAKTVTGIVCSSCRVAFDYQAMNAVVKIVKDNDLEVVTQTFDLHCLIELKIRNSMFNEICNNLNKIESVKIE